MLLREIWKVFDDWDGKPLKPDGRVHFHTIEEALDRVGEFAENIGSYVPITLEEDGTYKFFGNGKKVMTYMHH